jgi:hypothetical protein
LTRKAGPKVYAEWAWTNSMLLGWIGRAVSIGTVPVKVSRRLTKWQMMLKDAPAIVRPYVHAEWKIGPCGLVSGGGNTVGMAPLAF